MAGPGRVFYLHIWEETVNESDGHDQQRIILTVNNVWKVFGAEKTPLPGELRRSPKKEIREKTGLVLGLRDISFGVKKGEFFVIMGLSGSGKSTMIRTILRLIEPTEGEIIINGKNVCAMNKRELMELRRYTTSMVFQHFGLLPHYSVLQNAAYGLKVRGEDPDERRVKAREALETVGLKGWEDYRPGELSGGMQQRVGLARALATDPQILLMDEPFSGLDPLIRRQMQEELVELQKKVHKTIIFVTHDLHEAVTIGDRIAIMKDGQLVQVAEPEEIINNPANAYVREFVRDASPAKVLTARSIMEEAGLKLRVDQSAGEALDTLEEQGADYAFVVGRDDRLLGITSAAKLARSTKTNGHDLTTSLLDRHISCEPSRVLEEIIPLAVATRYPVAVVDGEGALLGEIDNATLLKNLVTSDETEAPGHE